MYHTKQSCTYDKLLAVCQVLILQIATLMDMIDDCFIIRHFPAFSQPVYQNVQPAEVTVLLIRITSRVHALISRPCH